MRGLSEILRNSPRAAPAAGIALLVIAGATASVRGKLANLLPASTVLAQDGGAPTRAPAQPEDAARGKNQPAVGAVKAEDQNPIRKEAKEEEKLEEGIPEEWKMPVVKKWTANIDIGGEFAYTLIFSRSDDAKAVKCERINSKGKSIGTTILDGVTLPPFDTEEERKKLTEDLVNRAVAKAYEKNEKLNTPEKIAIVRKNGKLAVKDAKSEKYAWEVRLLDRFPKGDRNRGGKIGDLVRILQDEGGKSLFRSWKLAQEGMYEVFLSFDLSKHQNNEEELEINWYISQSIGRFNNQPDALRKAKSARRGRLIPSAGGIASIDIHHKFWEPVGIGTRQ